MGCRRRQLLLVLLATTVAVEILYYRNGSEQSRLTVYKNTIQSLHIPAILNRDGLGPDDEISTSEDEDEADSEEEERYLAEREAQLSPDEAMDADDISAEQIQNEAAPPPVSRFPYVFQTKMDDIDCQQLIEGNTTEQLRALNYSMPLEWDPADEDFADLTRNCTSFIQHHGYVMAALNEEEEEYPIAFSILVHRETQLGERLLRAIYRPQNHYCVHVDLTSKPQVHEAWRGIAACFPNVFLTNVSIDVQWGKISVVTPELQCMRELLAYKKWRYFINLTGHEFPLRTNWELVQILKRYRGGNDFDTFHKWSFDGHYDHRFRYTTDERGAFTNITKEPPPHGIKIVMGYVHGTFSRAFVEYILFSKVAQDFLHWASNVRVPDEAFFSSLQHGNSHLKVPGSFIGDKKAIRAKSSMTRWKRWREDAEGFHTCLGKHTKAANAICIVGVETLPHLARTPKLFVNKLHYHYQPAALNCIGELMYNRTRDDFLGHSRNLNLTFYDNLEFVTNHINA